MANYLLNALWLVIFGLVFIPWLAIIAAPLVLAAAIFMLPFGAHHMFKKHEEQMDRIRHPSERPIHILVVEDDLDSIALIRKAFEALPKVAAIDYAMRESEAVRALSNKRFDVIVLDHDIPEFSGPEALERANQSLVNTGISESTPVITYTAREWSDWQSHKADHFRYVAHLKKNLPLANLREALRGAIAEPAS